MDMDMAPWFTTHDRLINRDRSRGDPDRSWWACSKTRRGDGTRGDTRVPLDIVQLHREEPIEFARWVGVPVVKAFGLGSGEREGGEERRSGYHHFVLVNSVVNVVDQSEGEGEKVSGGTGM